MTNTVSFAIAQKKIELPSFPGSEVMVKKISVGKKREIQQKYNLSTSTPDTDPSTIDAFFEMIVEGIASRNFVDEKSEPVAINKDNVSQLPEGDINEMMTEILGVDNLAKIKNG